MHAFVFFEKKIHVMNQTYPTRDSLSFLCQVTCQWSGGSRRQLCRSSIRACIIRPVRRAGRTATSEKSSLAEREMEREVEAGVSLHAGFQPAATSASCPHLLRCCCARARAASIGRSAACLLLLPPPVINAYHAGDSLRRQRARL